MLVNPILASLTQAPTFDELSARESMIKVPTREELAAQAYPERPEDLQAPILNINPPKPEAQASALNLVPGPKAPTLDELTAYPKRPEDLQVPTIRMNTEPKAPAHATGLKAPTIDELMAYPKRPEDLQVPVLNRNPTRPEAQAPALDLVPEEKEKDSGTIVQPEAQAPAYPAVTSMTDLVDKLNPYQPPTPEQLEAEKKRERSKSTISAISDGLSALANIYATIKGAAPQQLSSLSGANAQRRKAMLDKRQQLIDAKIRQTVQAKQQDDANALHKYSAEASAYNTNRAFETNKANRQEDVAHRDAQEIEAQGRWEKEYGIRKQNADTQEARVKKYSDNLKRLSDAQRIKIQDNEQKTLAKLVGKSVSFTHKDAKTGKDIRLDVPEKAITSSRPQLTELLINNPAYRPDLTGRMRSNHQEELNKLSEAKFVDVIKANAAKYPDMIRHLEQTKSLYLDEVYKRVQENTANLMAELEDDELGFQPDEQGNELPQTSEEW